MGHMGHIFITLAGLAVGALAGYKDNGLTLTAQSGLTDDLLPRISLSDGLDYVAAPNFDKEDSSRARGIKIVSGRGETQSQSIQNASPRSATIDTLTNEEFHPVLITRTVEKSYTSSASKTSSESWSGAPSGVKRKVERQLLQSDLTWGQSRTPAKPSNNVPAAVQREPSVHEQSSPSNKRPRSSASGLSDNLEEVTARSKSRHNSRNRSSSEAREWSTGRERTRVLVGDTKPPRKKSLTAAQRAQQNERQRRANAEEKRAIESGDPEAIKKRARKNARRRELMHEYRASNGDPIVPRKTQEERRATARARTAKYRARKSIQSKPSILEASLEDREKQKDNIGKAQAQEKYSTLDSEELNLPIARQESKGPRRNASNLGNSKQMKIALPSESGSESESESSGRSNRQDPFTSSISLSRKQKYRGSQASFSSDPSISRSPTPQQYAADSTGGRAKQSTNEKAKGVEQQRSDRQLRPTDKRNSAEVAHTGLHRQTDFSRNSPTISGQFTQGWSPQQLHSASPSLLPTQPSSPRRMQDNLSGLIQPNPALSGIPQHQTPISTTVQQTHDPWEQLFAEDGLIWPLITPPMSPLSFNSAHPPSPNSRGQ